MQVSKFHSWKQIRSIIHWYICNRCMKSSTPTVSKQDHTRCLNQRRRQWLRGSCTQQVSNYIMSVLNILFRLSSFSFYQQRSRPLCFEWYPMSRLSWSQWPDLHVSLIRVSCQRRERFCVTEYCGQPNRIQAKTYSCHSILSLGWHRPHQKYVWSAEFILAVTTIYGRWHTLRWKNVPPELQIFTYNACDSVALLQWELCTIHD